VLLVVVVVVDAGLLVGVTWARRRALEEEAAEALAAPSGGVREPVVSGVGNAG
jgi:hypothetical protein